MSELVGLLVVLLAVLAIAWRVEVRLVLLLAASLLGLASGNPSAFLKTFFVTLTAEKFVIPICTAMGFAQTLKTTGCDRALIRLLTEPLRRVRWLLLPGAVVVGFLVNIPIISQTSTALAVGAVLVPLLLAAGLKPVQVGAALLLGASMGGELLNPGAPELNTIAVALEISPGDCVGTMLPLLILYAGASLAFFWWRHRPPHGPREAQTQGEAEAGIRSEWWKAGVPLVPLLLLFVTGPPLNLVAIPKEWLVTAGKDAAYFDSRLIGLAMLVGTLLALLTEWRTGGRAVAAFFEGTGYAFTHIISLIVVAQCFGKGIELSGLAAYLGHWAEQHSTILLPMAALVPLAFAALSGSGMAAAQSLYGFFVAPAQALSLDPVQVGALVSIGAAAGRTMSPVSAVNLMCAKLTETSPLELTRTVAPPLLLGIAALIIAARFGLVLPSHP